MKVSIIKSLYQHYQKNQARLKRKHYQLGNKIHKFVQRKKLNIILVYKIIKD